MKYWVARVAIRPPFLLVNSSIHVTVETERPTASRSRQGRKHIRAVRIKATLARIESLPARLRSKGMPRREFASEQALREHPERIGDFYAWERTATFTKRRGLLSPDQRDRRCAHVAGREAGDAVPEGDPQGVGGERMREQAPE
jgi:hypothetical protein